jgi:type IV secretion system protein VirB2
MHPCWVRANAAFATISIILISSAAHAQDSYSDLGSGALGAAMRWLQGTLLGPIAAIVAVIAVATVGFMMLTGRIEVRRAVRVVLGCFIIFGASTIATGIVAALSASPSGPGQNAMGPPPFDGPPAAVPVNSVPAVTDPYAGAAVPQH